MLLVEIPFAALQRICRMLCASLLGQQTITNEHDTQLVTLIL